ncbi:hypothetical protein LWM68_39990 [Niabella sp. W65]|nr:hypothetical protein [Niabella sp. W65]MCH7368378.1 hypothetical protein [Niabella sp. W65]ULT46175.1 hypothetical protein KRR40_11670 [Niabella sp. I65]
MGKTKSFIGNIESMNNRAKYNLSHINLLADYFNLSPRDFLPEKVILKKRKIRKGVFSSEQMICKRQLY